MALDPEIIVKDGCFFRRTYTEQNLGPQNKLLQSMQTADYTIIPDVFSIEHPNAESYTKNDGKNTIREPVHMGRSLNALHVSHRLAFYPIYGHFYNTDDHLCFDGGTPDNHRIALPYPGLWMTYAFRLNNHRIAGFQNVFLTTNIKGRHYAPLLPNIFDNGKLCTGEITVRFDGDIRKTIQSLFNDFFFSRSNDHLVYDRAWEILRVKKDTLEWDPPEEFFRQPASWHRNRECTVAADFLQKLAELEETYRSMKISETIQEAPDGPEERNDTYPED